MSQSIISSFYYYIEAESPNSFFYLLYIEWNIKLQIVCEKDKKTAIRTKLEKITVFRFQDDGVYTFCVLHRAVDLECPRSC